MADFCKQCSLDHFNKDHRELAGITKPEDRAAGNAACVICEGCGPIQVDEDGNCIDRGCLRAGKPGHGIPFTTNPQVMEDEDDNDVPNLR